MPNITVIGVVIAATLALAQTASAERVCRSVCGGGTCEQRCTERYDHPAPPPRAGVDIHAHAPGAGVNVDVK
jgi:hypothetical protein